jgi:murein L,D-transpeptidase YcbB/YkuD
LKQFQEENHLNADGVLGARSLAALNLGPKEKLMRLELNLQRARQLPDDLGERVAMVNLPSGQMVGFENGDLKTTMRVVFGQSVEGRRTPIFHDVMQYVVFRPYWRVPMGIVKKEIAPNTEKDPQDWYKKGYEIVRDFSDKSPLRPSWDNLNAAAQGKLLVRQAPGRRPWLGEVPFSERSLSLHARHPGKTFVRPRRPGSQPRLHSTSASRQDGGVCSRPGRLG